LTVRPFGKLTAGKLTAGKLTAGELGSKGVKVIAELLQMCLVAGDKLKRGRII
jgi:hypothetical protein